METDLFRMFAWTTIQRRLSTNALDWRRKKRIQFYLMITRSLCSYASRSTYNSQLETRQEGTSKKTRWLFCVSSETPRTWNIRMEELCSCLCVWESEKRKSNDDEPHVTRIDGSNDIYMSLWASFIYSCAIWLRWVEKEMRRTWPRDQRRAWEEWRREDMLSQF